MSAGQPHEWERLDQGVAYCVRCPAISPYHNDTKCMSADPRTINTEESMRVRIVRIHPAQPKSVERASLPVEVKTELENLRRLVQTIQDRLHALTRA